MKMTLLEMTQNILGALSEDNVNSIGDTQSSYDVAEIVKETYHELFAHTNVPERMGLIQLEGLGDTSKPNYLRIPDNALRFQWIKYRNLSNDQYYDVTYKDPQDFLELVLSSARGSTEDVVDFSGATFLIQNNKQPSFWTTFDDRHIVFDSFNKGVENTVHQSNTMAFGESSETWTQVDSFIPPIPPELFPRLLAESKSVAFINLKQMTSAKEEARSRRQLVKWQKYKNKQRPQYTVDYSRKR
jgi:hypothetical protein